MISIKNGRGIRDGVPLRFQPSPNIGGRLNPEFIVLHDTASGLSSDGPISWLTSKASKVSAHVVVGRDGTITQLVPFDVKAWHAGQSIWNGRSLLNGFSVGIEIVNPGKLQKIGDGVYKGVGVYDTNKDPSLVVKRAKTQAHGDGYWLAYTNEQILAVIELCRALCATYPIEEVLTHWLIAPGRKVDTNPLFPLDQVRAAVQRLTVKRIAKPVGIAALPPQEAGQARGKSYEGEDYDAPIGTPDTDESDGAEGSLIKLFKSKIAWASSLLGTGALSSVASLFSDWRVVAVLGAVVVALVALILWERSKKP
jgi:N-acetyl-anhydromuramyl-L-alanine amidase AmpD